MVGIYIVLAVLLVIAGLLYLTINAKVDAYSSIEEEENAENEYLKKWEKEVSVN